MLSHANAALYNKLPLYTVAGTRRPPIPSNKPLEFISIEIVNYRTVSFAFIIQSKLPNDIKHKHSTLTF